MFTGKNVDALKLALEGAPLCSKNQQIKVNVFYVRNLHKLILLLLFLHKG